MGTLTGHLLPGAAFSFLGLWHLVNTATSYRLSGRSSFSSRTWFPSPFIKHLELLFLLLLSLFSSTFLLFFSPSSSPSDLEHASMFLHLIIYSSAALAADLLPSPSSSSSSIVGVLAASAFAQQLLLLHFHSIDHTGIEGHYHSLMQIAVAACLASTVVTVGFPSSYEAAVVRSAAVAMQGMWFVCMGLVLWGPERFLPAGCEVEGAAVVCAGAGAVAAANVQFSWMVAGVAAIAAAICLAPVGNGIEYRKLGNVGRNSGDGGGEGGGGGVKPQV